jgi:hypothetical protein
LNVEASSTGTSEPLTEEGLASVFEGFLSDEPEYKETAETPPAQESPEPEAQTAEVEPSTEPGQTEEGQSEETEQTEESQTETPQTHRVKVNGEEVEVTLDELYRGYSRTQDYTRKTQELSEKRRAAEEHVAAVRAGREQYAGRLAELEQAIKDTTPQEPDWVALQQESPDQFPTEWARWSQYRERMVALATERHQAEQAVLADRQEQFTVARAKANEQLLELIPEWKSDAAKAKSEKAEMVSLAEEVGYTRDELRSVVDPRIMVVLRDAMRYRALQKKRPQIQEQIQKVKTATPGPSGANRTKKSATAIAQERLEQSGSIDDLADLFIAKGLAG